MSGQPSVAVSTTFWALYIHARFVNFFSVPPTPFWQRHDDMTVMMGLAHTHTHTKSPLARITRTRRGQGRPWENQRMAPATGTGTALLFLPRGKKKKRIGSGALSLTRSNRDGRSKTWHALVFSCSRSLSQEVFALFPLWSCCLFLDFTIGHYLAPPRCLKCVDLHARSSELEVLGRPLQLLLASEIRFATNPYVHVLAMAGK